MEIDNLVLAKAENILDDVNAGLVQLIDARKYNEYVEGHLPKARSLPLWNLLRDDSPKGVAKTAGNTGIDGKTPIVIYDDSFGAVASRVGWTLERAGHGSVLLLDRTYTDCTKMGIMMELGEPESKDVVFEATPCMDKGVDLADVEAIPSDVILIDNRERLNFLESHIPGAVNIPYRMLGDRNSILRSSEELKRIFDNRGIDEKSKIITYCGSAGTLSGLAYYALRHAGINGVKLYANSFKEWKASNKPTKTQEDANYWDLSAE